MSELDKNINNNCHTVCPHCNYQTLVNPLYCTVESGFCENGVFRDGKGGFEKLSYTAINGITGVNTFKCPNCEKTFEKKWFAKL